MGFFDAIGDAFSGAYNSVKDAVSGAVSTVIDVGKAVVGKAIDVGTKAVNYVADKGGHLIDSSLKTLDSVGGGIGGLASLLGNPMVVIGGLVVGGIVLTKVL